MKIDLDARIKKAMTVGPAAEFPERLKSELRDLFAHVAMLAAENEAERAAMIKMFNYVFKDVPAFRKGAK